MIGFFLLLILIFVIIPIGIGILIFYLLKKYSNKRVAKYFAIIYALIYLGIAGSVIFEDQLFTKNDAKKLVEEQNINLSDNFKLTENNTETAIGDYYHTFTLEISGRDKDNAINEITNSKDFKKSGEKIIDYPYSAGINRYEGTKQIQNYETNSEYVREYFQPNGQGYAPTFRRIKIEKYRNNLIFEDIDD